MVICVLARSASPGKVLRSIFQHPQILNDHAIQALLIQGTDIIRNRVHLLIFQQGIQRQIQLFPLQMQFVYRLQQLLFRKVPGKCPGTELRSAGVDGIRPCGSGGLHPFIGACRCQKLRLSFPHGHPPKCFM